uniref:Uncharacterized protein n=1 Tax=Ditylum brightwellii TaxID=49249 RepID=A0A7S4VEV2_9STRA
MTVVKSDRKVGASAMFRKDNTTYIITATFLLITAIFIYRPFPGTEVSQYESVSGKRPIIYTYFSWDASRQDIEHYTKEQEEMIDFWKTRWSNAGWEPRILSEEDAKRYPKFNQYDEQISKLDLLPSKRLCFYRWMAMSAATDGGWMSEHDIYPLHVESSTPKNMFVLPNNGRLTIYENNLNHGAFPSLVSGSSAEWNRVTAALLEYVPQHEGEMFHDVRALGQLNIERPKSFELVDGVTNAVVLKTGLGQTRKIDCRWYSGKIALHFSYKTMVDAIKYKTIRRKQEAQSRAFYAKRFLNDFRHQCEGTR